MSSLSHISISGRNIGADYPPYIVAEMSGNHNGKLQTALQFIDMAKRCGADAIKIQTYTPDTLTIDCDKEEFRIKGGLWDGYTLYKLYEMAQTPFEWQKELFEYSRKKEITMFSTPFDETAVDLLEDLDVPAYKIASFESIDLPLIRYVANTGKPMIISTGMENREEIEETIAAARDGGCKELILLHCISAYPAPIEQANLLTIPDMIKRFGVQVGLSDHTLSNIPSIASVALGATLIEKHVTLDRNDKGPDSEFSIEPDELLALCNDTRGAWSALGKAGYEIKPDETQNLVFRRSIYFVKSLRAGETITREHIRRIRPGYGLKPKYYDQLIGRTVAKDIEPGQATSWELIND